MKKIIAISMVKNESDVIESFVRYNLRYVDELHIVDHHSTDNTLKILNLLKQEGLPIFLYNTPIITHKQPRILTDLMHHCLTNDPAINYCIALDADEFIYAKNKTDFQQSLQQIPTNRVGLLIWQTYLPSAIEINPYFLSDFSDIRHDNIIMTKVVFSRQIGLERHLSAGNHQLNRVYTESYEKTHMFPSTIFLPNHLNQFKSNLQQNIDATFIDTSSLMLAHYPVRSVPQIISKTLVGTLQMYQDNLENQDQDLYWQAIAHSIFNRSSYDLNNLRTEAYLYRNTKAYYPNLNQIQIKIAKSQSLVQEKLKLSYSHLININPLENVFKTAMQLIRDYSVKKQK